MPGSAERPSIVAICGVDGAGKSSLIARLRERQRAGRVLYVKKDISRCNQLIQHLHARPHGDQRDLNEGPYGAMLATADALDFLDYYRTKFYPALTCGHWDLIISDRYTPCFVAYLSCVAPGVDSKQLFSKLELAELAIYIDVDRMLLPHRFDRRGGAAEDENPALIERFAGAYRAALSCHAKRAVRIENNGDIEKAYGQLVGILQNNFDVEFGKADDTGRTS